MPVALANAVEACSGGAVKDGIKFLVGQSRMHRPKVTQNHALIRVFDIRYINQIHVRTYCDQTHHSITYKKYLIESRLGNNSPHCYEH
jgi:hypothetical protein